MNTLNDKMKEISDKIVILKNLMNEKFPGCFNTIMINIWDDGDYRVICRYGTNDELIHNFVYHKFTDTTEYIQDVFLANAIKSDKLGNQFYIPNELIPFLNSVEIESDQTNSKKWSDKDMIMFALKCCNDGYDPIVLMLNQYNSNYTHQ